MSKKILVYCYFMIWAVPFARAVANGTNAAKEDDLTCVDLHPLCPFWKSSLGCTGEAKDFMQKKCTASCGVNCGPDQQRVKLTCINADENCSRWVAQDECRTNVHFMIWKCSAACGFCKDNKTIIRWPKVIASVSPDVSNARLISGPADFGSIHDVDLRQAIHAAGIIAPPNSNSVSGGYGGGPPQISLSIDEAVGGENEAVILTNFSDPFALSAEERDVLTTLFKELDADHSGSIGLPDINVVANKHNLTAAQFYELQEIITDFDLIAPSHKRDREVFEEEFIEAVINLDSRRQMTKALVGLRASEVKPVLLLFIELAHKDYKKHARDHCYQLLHSNVNNHDAASACQSIGASLPVFEKESWAAFQSVAKARNIPEDHTFWLNLQPQPGGKWAWIDLIPSDQSGWSPGASASGIGSNDQKCAISQEIYGGAPSFAEESCLTKSSTTYALCQRQPSFVNVLVSQLNDKFDGQEQISNAKLIIPYRNTILQLSVGKPSDDLKNISGNLEALNGIKQENTLLAQLAGPDSLKPAEASPPASLTHDMTENGDCLAAKIPKERACAPAAGKRKKRGLCNERRKRTIYKFPNIDWPVSPKIKYVFDFAAENHKPTFESAKAAMDFWSKHTCVEFVEVDKKSFELPQVIIARREGCWSSIGRDKKQKIVNLPKVVGAQLGKQGVAGENPQILSLGDGCSKFNIAAHEFGHLLGLEHEQARNDRGNFVVINYENIQPDKIYNFARCGECCVDPPGYPYDYGSIMHYASTEFARAGSNAETITDVTPGQIYRNTMGKAWEPSFYDVKQVNEQLCEDSCPTGGVCENGGYAHPRDCGTCICPAGFGGAKCGTLEPGSPKECGGQLDAGEEWQAFTTPGFPIYSLEAGQKCSWIIKAPANNVVQLKIEEKGFDFPEDCTYGSVSVKYQDDLAVSGVQYCGKRPPGLLKSKTQTMLVQLRLSSLKNIPSRGFKALYRFVPKPAQACLSEDQTYPNGRFWRD